MTSDCVPHQVTLDEEGRHHSILTVGHDSDAVSGEWTLAVTASEPIVISKVIFDVGNDIRVPMLFRTAHQAPFEVVSKTGLLTPGDQVLIKGRDAMLLKNGRPSRAIPRADSAWYTLAQQVTLVGLKGRAKEKIDLRVCGLPPCNAVLVNPDNPKTHLPMGSALAARVTVHFHGYFGAKPLTLKHLIKLDGRGSATQVRHVLHDPERLGPPMHSSPGYLRVVALVTKVQARWRALMSTRVLRPSKQQTRAERAATSVQAASRGARARSNAVMSAAEDRVAVAESRERGWETWGTLHPVRTAQPAQDVSSVNELRETLQEAEARRARQAASREGQLQQRALQRERDQVSRVLVRPA